MFSEYGQCNIEKNIKTGHFVHNCMGLLQECCKKSDLIVETKVGAKLLQQ